MNIQFGTALPPATAPTAAPAASPPGAGAPAPAPAAMPPAPGATPAQAPQILSSDVAKQIASQINDFLRTTSANVEFSVVGDSNKVVVRIVDTQTKQLIRQIPSEQMLEISQVLDRVSGVLLNQKAG